MDEAPFPALQISVLAQVIASTVNKGVELLPWQDNYPFGGNFAPLVYHRRGACEEALQPNPSVMSRKYDGVKNGVWYGRDYACRHSD